MYPNLRQKIVDLKRKKVYVEQILGGKQINFLKRMTNDALVFHMDDWLSCFVLRGLSSRSQACYPINIKFSILFSISLNKKKGILLVSLIMLNLEEYDLNS